jgi:hypothetical protein
MSVPAYAVKSYSKVLGGVGNNKSVSSVPIRVLFESTTITSITTLL